VIETGNNDLPCQCQARSKARFNVSGTTGMIGPVTADEACQLPYGPRDPNSPLTESRLPVFIQLWLITWISFWDGIGSWMVEVYGCRGSQDQAGPGCDPETASQVFNSQLFREQENRRRYISKAADEAIKARSLAHYKESMRRLDYEDAWLAANTPTDAQSPGTA
jgi:hypothetical protein